MNILIIDYGMGNLRSVANAFGALGQDARISDNPADLSQADRIVLPGVGAFGDAMQNLTTRGFLEPLEKEVIQKGKFFLGLCLGLQLLATTSSEHGLHQGLNWIPGKVEKIKADQSSLRVPHIGWNDVQFKKKNGLFNNLGEKQAFYFVHSFALHPEDSSVVSGVCDYGTNLVASIEKGNILATQFHPEKSQKAGLTLLKNFINLN